MDDHRHVPVAIKVPKRPGYAEGGLASAAKNVAGAGVGGDTMIVHINKPEFDELRKRWGEPTINPHTKMAQFTPIWQQDWFAPVAGLAGSALAAPLVGDAISGATGLGDTASKTIGGALVGGGIGALSNGGQGALTGALAGGAGPLLMSMLNGGDSGFSSLLGLGGSNSNSNSGSLINPINNSDSSSSSSKDSSSGGGLFGGKGGALPALMAGLLLANTIGKAATGGKSDAEKAAEANAADAKAQFNKPLPQVSFQRQTQTFQPQDYKTYGFQPAKSQFSGNMFPQRVDKAKGGRMTGALQSAAQMPRGAVRGPGDGRADVIPANLSNGEYVMDADTVSMLGNGSTDAGASRLDQMRMNLRKHKGKALSKGKFSPDAKAPEQYMRGGKA